MEHREKTGRGFDSARRLTLIRSSYRRHIKADGPPLPARACALQGCQPDRSQQQRPMVSCKTRGRCEPQSPRPVPALLTDTEIGRAGAPPANSLPPRACGESGECAGSGTGGKTRWRIGSRCRRSTGVDATSDSERPSGAPAPSFTETSVFTCGWR